METMQPTLKRGRDVWDRINMPRVEFLERVEKIREHMQERGMDVLLVYATGGNEYGDPCYISNYIMKMSQGTAVAITRAGDVTLICEGFARDTPALKSITWVEDVRSCDDVSQRTVAYLKEKNLIPSTLGLVGLEQSMPHGQYQFFSESTRGCKIVLADDMIRTMRMIKSQREADQIRRSSRLAARVFEQISRGSFQHVNEKKLEAKISRETYMEGAEDVRVLIAKPTEERWAFRPLEDVPLCDNHPIIIYLAVELERYWAEGIRTYLFKDNAFTQPAVESVNSLYNRIIGSVTPGKKVSQFYRDALDRIKANSMDVILEYGLGQGIGLSLQEPPFLTAEDPAQLQEGMCMTFRLALKNRELGAIMIGDTVHLSKGGPEVLTRE
jgi:Xaa-Pro aminopeptidase